MVQKDIENGLDSMSYTLGLDMGLKLRTNLPEVNEELYLQGLYNGIDSADIQVNIQDIERIIGAYMERRRQEQIAQIREQRLREAEANFGDLKEAGVAFLETNKNKPGVVTTDSGLQYEVLREGTGEKPTAASRVSLQIYGTTIDGVVVDSTLDEDPKQYYLGRVLRGWAEGIPLMKEGAKYRFYIPQELAYGINPPKAGEGPIKPFMPLIYEIELIKIH
jgi:FKBP-type peptidyl-prolyl cis-trans isomerase FklB